MTELLEEALKLPVAERIRFADKLYESAAPPRSAPLTDAQVAELERRIAYHEAHPENAVPWDEVRERWRKRA